ncbi:MAG: serpin family protein [Akkermansia sp.]|nr:serpin family protein [Akkermansia sp.]
MKTKLTILLSLLGLAACGGNSAESEVQQLSCTKPAPTPAVKAAPCFATDSFAVQMFSVLATAQQGNIVFSPASLEGLLHLLEQGARGNTSKELTALPMGKQGVNSALNPVEANALFIAEGFMLKPGIRTDEVIRVPFARDAAAAATEMNAWANKHTCGLIPSVISEKNITPLTRMVAANAIYLKEQWLRPFKKSSTRDNSDFTLPDGSKTKVSMMYNRSKYLYAAGEDWQAVALFYKTEGRSGEPGCFIGILPTGNAREFAASLTPQKYQDIRRALLLAEMQDTIVQLPRFELNPGTYSLKPALQTCGLSTIFTPQANFSGFSDEKLYLSDVIQRCYVKADEEGTEAAAVTMGVMVKSCATKDPIKPKKITFDRPFIWIIGDLNTAAAPYFMGITEKP